MTKKQLLISMKNILLFFFALFLFLSFSACEEKPVELEYTISPASLSFDATGGTDEFIVSVKSPATVESVIKALATWCQVSRVTWLTESSVNVILTITPNYATEMRSTSVVINVRSGKKRMPISVRITQEGIEFDEEGKWVLINGVKWATRNVDAPGAFTTKPEDEGMFYQWNRKVGWSITDPLISSNGDTIWNSTGATGDIWEKANDPCPTGWRVPTIEELQSLVNSGSQWATINGIDGRIFGSGNNSSLFMPAAGYRPYFGIRKANMIGLYWSSTVFGDPVLRLDFGYESVSTEFTTGRACGLSVRCVLE